MSAEKGSTPGPWEFRVYSDGCTIVSQHCEPTRSVRDRLKGVTVSVDACINDDQSNAMEASADARLIASAPTLAAELAKLREDYSLLINALGDVVNMHCMPTGHGYVLYRDKTGAMAKAREALSKGRAG